MLPIMDEHYPFALPPLPFDYDALEPELSAKTMHFHHDKHFAAYVDKLNQLLDDVIAQCDAAGDWRQVRDWIEENHNYAKYQGNCPMVTNHLAVVMALKLAGDDFRKSISIAARRRMRGVPGVTSMNISARGRSERVSAFRNLP